ncbi:MAG TPA: mechanosensitive ion channel [Phycisphaerae bacterium]|nr:mechanosensitive ion channel [Phycisphaerae bacterium]HRW51875.1 mechanosensitive ion channel [Phycisphaerae bacterium]
MVDHSSGPTTQPADAPPATSQPAVAQPSVDNPADTPPVVPPPEPVKTTSDEKIDALVKRVESSTLEPPQKEDAQAALREAKARLEELRTWEARATSFQDRIRKAPDELDKLKQPDPTTQPTTQPATSVEAPLEEVEAQLRAEQAKLDAERERATNSKEAVSRRSTFLVEGPKEISRAREELTKLESQPVKQDGPELVVEARRERRVATRMTLNAKIAALEAELRFYENHGELLLAEQDRAVQRRDAREAFVKELRSRVAALRQKAAEQAREKAEDVSTRVRRIFPKIEDLIRENKSLADALASNSQQTASLTTIDDQVKAEFERVKREFDEAREKAKTANVSQSFGILLRSQLNRLPDTDEYRRLREKQRNRLDEAAYEWSGYKPERDRLSNTDAAIEDWVSQLSDKLSESDRTLARDEIRRQVLLKKESLDKLISNDDYVKLLNKLETDLTNLIRETEAFRDFINERILWVRSGRPIGTDNFRGLMSALEWFFNAENWGEFFSAAASYYAVYWFLGIPALIVVGVLFAIRRPLRTKLRAAANAANEPLSTDFRITLSSCFYTLLLAIPYPLTLWFIGQAFLRVPESGDFAGAVAGGFHAAAMTAFPLLFLIHVCRVHGLAGAHLAWDAKAIGILRRNLIWFVSATVPVSFVVGMLSNQGVEAHSETFGRDVFILGMIFITIFIARVLKPRAGALTQYMIEHPQGRLVQFRYVIYALFVSIPPALIVGAALGYYYTVLRLSARCWMTALIWIAAIIIYLLLMRWLLLARRRIAIDQAMRKRAEAKAKAEARAKEEAERAARASEKGEKPVEAPSKPVQAEEPMINIPSLSQQTRQLIGSLTIFAVAGLTFWVWSSELPALNILHDIRITEWDVSVADIGLAAIAAFVAFIAVRNIPALLEIAVLSHLPIDAGARYAVSAISRYVIGTIGIVVTFGLLGVGWSKVQWLVAAVSVGLGFGLQEIFANFVSGLIILFERPIRIGDTVTVGTQTGTVSRIRIRSTCITDWDNKELVIPNKRFVTDEITNWTLSSEILRLVIPVGVSYSSNPRQVRDVLMQVLEKNGKVMTEPAPRVYFLGFGDSALNFECRAYFKCIDDMMVGRHSLYVEIFEACQREEIEIAFPQRDIHIRSINATLPIGRGQLKRDSLEAEAGEGA